MLIFLQGLAAHASLACMNVTRLTCRMQGAGMTPYSRRADGRAVMRSSLRGAPLRSACSAACRRIEACPMRAAA